MKIKDATFISGAVSPAGYPKAELPEVAFVGRSNVGKSTLINALLNRKKLARTSSTPGKTREINFFLINDRFHVVDLPGYGFAKVPLSEKNKWRERIETYLKNRKQLKLVVVLMDIRHKPSEQDHLMVDWLAHYERPVLVAATKADKLSRSARAKAVQSLTKEIGLPPVRVSAKDREGLDELWRHVTKALFPS